MNYSVESSKNFEKEAIRLLKKYKSLKGELSRLFDDLEADPKQGTHLGNAIYKIRIAIASKGRGKSGGGRILTLVKTFETKVVLFSIYNKGEKDTMTEKEIQRLIDEL